MDINELLNKSDIDLLKFLANTNDQELIKKDFKQYATEQLKNGRSIRTVASVIRDLLKKNEEVPICFLACNY